MLENKLSLLILEISNKLIVIGHEFIECVKLKIRITFVLDHKYFTIKDKDKLGLSSAKLRRSWG
jgi:hypothetical protein